MGGETGTGRAAAADEPDPFETSYANEYDVARGEALARREADWRNGPVVYQVIVDRFAPSADLEAKRALYPPPKRLRAWDEPPARGRLLPEVGVWSHEIDFWGGDLRSLLSKLDYIAELGANVLYLNPIQQAYTNHKYDAQDYFAVSPEYGTRDDVRALAEALHARGMKLVLDGVFNHMGRTAPWFQEALADAKSTYRDWFYIGDEYEHGYRGWANVANLPELRLENPAVRTRLWGDADSVVQGYLRDGVDGWRLDVAPELGFKYLSELTQAAHAAKEGSLVVGENWVYPEEWSPALDGVLNFYYQRVISALVDGSISGAHAARMVDRMIADTGLDAVLKSWIVLDNHDTARLKNQFPKLWQQRMAQVLQFTLPGSPCVYYGVELGMDGGEDPEQRGPMRWDLANDENPDLQWTRRLLGMRRANRALTVGDFRLLDTQQILAFARRTDRAAETIIVVANPMKQKVTDMFPVREAKLMDWTTMRNVLGAGEAQVRCGTLAVAMPPQTIWVLKPETKEEGGNSYKRVQ